MSTRAPQILCLRHSVIVPPFEDECVLCALGDEDGGPLPVRLVEFTRAIRAIYRPAPPPAATKLCRCGAPGPGPCPACRAAAKLASATGATGGMAKPTGFRALGEASWANAGRKRGRPFKRPADDSEEETT
jgi:hypothetical protein